MAAVIGVTRSFRVHESLVLTGTVQPGKEDIGGTESMEVSGLRVF